MSWNALEEEFKHGLGRYTMIHNPNESNLDRVAGLMAEDMYRSGAIKKDIRARLELFFVEMRK